MTLSGGKREEGKRWAVEKWRTGLEAGRRDEGVAAVFLVAGRARAQGVHTNLERPEPYLEHN